MLSVKEYLSIVTLYMLFFISLSQQTQQTRKPSIIQQNCLQTQLPKKFGIKTTTYIRQGGSKMFLKYLQRYAEMDCDIFDNIYIIWNNQESPEQMGVFERKKYWKKNVYFLETISNSLDYKYIVPDWVEEDVFFSMDDDFGITCQTLKRGFAQWQQSATGQIGPLASFYGRSFVFDLATQQYTYIDQVKLKRNWNTFNIALTGIAFIPRHFFQMYYSQIFEFKQMRKQVSEKMNCQDISLNFIIGYLYPQLKPKYINIQFESYGISGISATLTHKKFRQDCIKHFTQILGFNPVRRYQAEDRYPLQQKRTDLNFDCMINLKHQHYEKNFVNNRAYLLYIDKISGVDNQFIKQQNKRLAKAKINIQNLIENRKDEYDSEQQQSNRRFLKKQAKNKQSKQDKRLLQDFQLSLHYESAKSLLSDQFKQTDHNEEDFDEKVSGIVTDLQLTDDQRQRQIHTLQQRKNQQMNKKDESRKSQVSKLSQINDNVVEEQLKSKPPKISVIMIFTGGLLILLGMFYKKCFTPRQKYAEVPNQ